MNFESKRLRQILQQVYDKHSTTIAISPALLANEAMSQLDPEHRSEPVIALAANLQFRQVARAICRGYDNDDLSPQHSMDFHKALQMRYPTARSQDFEDPEYILLDHMSDEDYGYNIQRLEREADAKLAHARALKAHWEMKGQAKAA